MSHIFKLSFNGDIITFHIKNLLPEDRDHRSVLLDICNAYISVEVIAKEKQRREFS